MSPFSPLDLLQAHAWRRALFTTYSLSLSFFESVVLDGLVRNGAREAVVLADAEGVRNALSELGARRVGRDYEVEPVAVERGCVFHPKVAVLASDSETCGQALPRRGPIAAAIGRTAADHEQVGEVVRAVPALHACSLAPEGDHVLELQSRFTCQI